MARKRRGGGGGHDEGGGGHERWLLTYADMITLLLALFIVLFAMSTIDATQFNALKQSLSNSFRGSVLEEQGNVLGGSQNVLDGSAPTQASSPATIEELKRESVKSQGQALQRQQKRLSRIIARSGATSKARVVPSQRGFTITLAGDAFFQSGSAELVPQVERVLTKIAGDLQSERRQVAIEGHTDGVPISTAQFPDNEVLSAMRAHSIYSFLARRGVKRERMRITGYADTRPRKRPVYPQQPVSANRRVEIVVLAPGADVRAASRDHGGLGGKSPVGGEHAGGNDVISTQIVDPIVVLTKQ